jgi:hypothetical protein
MLLIFSACTTLIQWQMGIKSPKLESHDSLTGFLEKKKLTGERLLIVQNLKSYAALSKKNWNSFPEALFFDREGRFVPYKETAQSCNAGVGSFVSSIQDLDQLERIDSITADTLLQYLEESKSGRKIRFTELPSADLHVFLLWARFAGKLNQQKVWDWQAHFRKARENGLQIEETLISMDLQEKWDLKPDEKARLRESGIKIK